MTNIHIDDRQRYKLYVTNLLNKNIKMSEAMRKLVIELAMQSFDDGIAFNQNNLKVKGM